MFKKLRKPRPEREATEDSPTQETEEWAPDPNAPISTEMQHMLHHFADTPEEYAARLEQEFKAGLDARVLADKQRLGKPPSAD